MRLSVYVSDEDSKLVKEVRRLMRKNESLSGVFVEMMKLWLADMRPSRIQRLLDEIEAIRDEIAAIESEV